MRANDSRIFSFTFLNASEAICFFAMKTVSYPFLRKFISFPTISLIILFTLLRSTAFFDTFLLTTNPALLFPSRPFTYFNRKRGVEINLPFASMCRNSLCVINLWSLLSTENYDLGAAGGRGEPFSSFSPSSLNSTLAVHRLFPREESVFFCPPSLAWFICF